MKTVSHISNEIKNNSHLFEKCFAVFKSSCIFVSTKRNNKMKTQTYTKQLTAIMPRNNGTQAGINALAASLIRSQSLNK